MEATLFTQDDIGKALDHIYKTLPDQDPYYKENSDELDEYADILRMLPTYEKEGVYFEKSVRNADGACESKLEILTSIWLDKTVKLKQYITMGLANSIEQAKEVARNQPDLDGKRYCILVTEYPLDVLATFARGRNLSVNYVPAGEAPKLAFEIIVIP